MKPIRSDLAIEILEDLNEHHSLTDGIEYSKSQNRLVSVEKVKILNRTGEQNAGKPIGTYLTMNTGKIWLDDPDAFREKATALGEELAPFVKAEKSGPILVAGLGNRGIISDAIGPKTVQNLMVTRHLRTEAPALFQSLNLAEVCAITPGVLGQTGMESADVVEAVVHQVSPRLVLVVDALASRSLERLATTIQISDTGLAPGSGVGNARAALTKESLHIPVVSIGVPTVVDAATLAADAIEMFSEESADEEAIRDRWRKNGLNFFVTPKETDQIIGRMGTLIGYGLNLALHKPLQYEEMLSWIG